MGIRKLLSGTAIACAALALAMAGPAEAQDKRVRVAYTSTFGSGVALLGPTAISIGEKLKRMSAGSIDIRFNEPGALVPANQMFDAVSAGSVDMVWATPGFWTGKDIAFAMFASVPFGPGAGEYLAWMYHGGGVQQMKELYGKYNIEVQLCGVISPEASGWFRREIKTLDDLKGLKMRFFGLGAKVMEKLGVSTQLILPGEIFQALQLGTIDATEFSMPVMDLSLGFHQVAKHYYFPGWHQQSTLNEMMISKAKWNEFSDAQKAMVEVACEANVAREFAEGEAVQFKAIQDIQAKGVTLHRWSDEFLNAFEKAWNEVAKEEAAKSATFKKAWDSYSSFRENYKVWRELGYLK
ncbi:MAG: TRAP transporter substrate-binding protein [Alphaproteobacteria bacterium]|nr:TRAP transporter substrate-binding protein [Alphaproteobacteria bacterium]